MVMILYFILVSKVFESFLKLLVLNLNDEWPRMFMQEFNKNKWDDNIIGAKINARSQKHFRILFSSNAQNTNI